MNIMVSGASGFFGSKLVPSLLDAGHYVVCVSRDARQLSLQFPRRVHIVEADALKPESLDGIFRGIDVAYYLIHSLHAGESGFGQVDQAAAHNFATAAKAASVQRIIYLDGLGDRDGDLSPHPRIRQEIRQALREYGPPLTEFRSAVVVGAGSTSFEMVRHLGEHEPIVPGPRWVSTVSQSIALGALVSSMFAALDVTQIGPMLSSGYGSCAQVEGRPESAFGPGV
jgi:uncharacterized protein YbjT (DUF2867 family)